MKLQIEHNTEYTYTWPVLYSIQHIRLVPQHNATQSLEQWDVQAAVPHTLNDDHFGNKVAHLTLNHTHNRLKIVSHGIVELHGLDKGYLDNERGHPHPMVFMGSTPLTAANPDIVQFSSFLSDSKIPFEHRILTLAQAVADRVAYTPGSTTVSSTAIEAFDHGKGVCQDHAHLMLACLRAHGFCGRYVSGYYFSEHATEHTSHAWVDVLNPDTDRWLSVDATHRGFAGQNHCRIAVARDFTGASPVRGVRSGGGKEKMQVSVSIKRL